MKEMRDGIRGASRLAETDKCSRETQDRQSIACSCQLNCPAVLCTSVDNVSIPQDDTMQCHLRAGLSTVHPEISTDVNSVYALWEQFDIIATSKRMFSGLVSTVVQVWTGQVLQTIG